MSDSSVQAPSRVFVGIDVSQQTWDVHRLPSGESMSLTADETGWTQRPAADWLSEVMQSLTACDVVDPGSDIVAAPLGVQPSQAEQGRNGLCAVARFTDPIWPLPADRVQPAVVSTRGLLFLLTERKVADQYRAAATQKRGGGDAAAQLLGRSAADIQDLADQEPGPEFVATLNDSLARALIRLAEPTTRETAILRMEGYQNHEIADRLEISLSTVERKLRVIREVWQEEFAD